MRSISVFFIFLLSVSAFAHSDSEATKRATRAAAYEQLVEWMKKGPFYRISSVDVSETDAGEGQTGAKAVLRFDDSLGCKGRELIANCIAVEDAHFCQFALSDCIPPHQLITRRIFH